MGWLNPLVGLFRRRAKAKAAAPAGPVIDGDHAVIISIRLEGEWASNDGIERLFDLSDRIGQALAAAGVGHLDGEGAGQDMFDIFTYGPDADRMWGAIAPLLEPLPLPRGSYARRRYGQPDAPDVREDRVELHWDG